MFGRATIRLGIGPHSSSIRNTLFQNFLTVVLRNVDENYILIMSPDRLLPQTSTAHTLNFSPRKTSAGTHVARTDHRH